MSRRKSTLAAGDDDGVVRLYDVRAIGKIGEYKTPDQEVVRSLAFSRSGRLLFVAYKTNTIMLWDVLTEKQVTKLPDEHKKSVTSLGID